jgi:hypothetical protein
MEFFCASEESINRFAEVNILHPAMALLPAILFLRNPRSRAAFVAESNNACHCFAPVP